MTRRKAKEAPIGQVDVFGTIHGLDKLVNKPSVIEVDGMRVVQIVIPQKEVETKGYVETALGLARKLQPETQSKSKPPWLDANWHIKKRKERYG